MEEKLIVIDDSYLPEITALYKKCFEGDPWNDNWSDENQLTEYIKEVAYAYRPLNYGLLSDGTLCAVAIGHIKHWWQGTEYYLDEFFVDPDYQGEGIGSRFMERMEADLKQRDLKGVFLQTENDKPAYDFYRKKGYQELRGHVSFFKAI